VRHGVEHTRSFPWSQLFVDVRALVLRSPEHRAWIPRLRRPIATHGGWAPNPQYIRRLRGISFPLFILKQCHLTSSRNHRSLTLPCNLIEVSKRCTQMEFNSAKFELEA
jgi:hypothetical protein